MGWKKDASFVNALRTYVSIWNRNVFGNILARKRRVLARIGGVQWALETYSTPNMRKLDHDLRVELTNVFLQEERLWRQRATCNWNVHEDRNSAFYHAYTRKKAKQNRVDMLKLSSWELCANDTVLRQEAIDFFQCLYLKEDVVETPWHLRGSFPMLSTDDMDIVYV